MKSDWHTMRCSVAVAAERTAGRVGRSCPVLSFTLENECVKKVTSECVGHYGAPYLSSQLALSASQVTLASPSSMKVLSLKNTGLSTAA